MSNKPLKLFVDAHTMDKEYQGTYTFLQGLYSAFMQAYPDVEVYFGTSNPVRLQFAFPGLNKRYILTYRYAKPGLLRYMIDIPLLIKRHRFDFAHFQYIIPRRQAGCRYVVTLHDIIFNDFEKYFSFAYRQSRQYLFARSIKNADIKTTVSAYSQSRIAGYYQLPQQQIHILANGVEQADPTTADKLNAQRLIKTGYGIENFILYVSRIEPRKNHQLLLRTYLEQRLYQQQIALVFIGKKSVQVPALQTLVNGLTAEQKQHVYFIDQVAQADLALFYRACRLFVYPSIAEGFGIPPLEAAMHRAPVLCSNATAMQSFSFFEPHIFDPNNEEAFAEKLTDLLANPPTSAFLDNVANQIKQQYNWQQTAGILYNLLISS